MEMEKDVLVDVQRGGGEERKVERNQNKVNENKQEEMTRKKEQDWTKEGEDNVWSEQTLRLCSFQTLRAAMSQKNGGSLTSLVEELSPRKKRKGLRNCCVAAYR